MLSQSVPARSSPLPGPAATARRPPRARSGGSRCPLPQARALLGDAESGRDRRFLAQVAGQPMGRVDQGLERAESGCAQFAHRLVQQRASPQLDGLRQFLLGGEMEVQRPFGHSGERGDPAERRARVAVAVEHLGPRLHQLPAGPLRPLLHHGASPAHGPGTCPGHRAGRGRAPGVAYGHLSPRGRVARRRSPPSPGSPGWP